MEPPEPDAEVDAGVTGVAGTGQHPAAQVDAVLARHQVAVLVHDAHRVRRGLAGSRSGRYSMPGYQPLASPKLVRPDWARKEVQ